MIVDFHTHIFPKKMRENREFYFPSESAFKLLYSSQKAKLAGSKELVKAMDEQGVDKSVIFGFPWKTSDTFKRHNDYIMDAVQKYHGRLIGFCCFDPFNSDAVSETERGIDGGLLGIGELAFYESGINEACLARLVPLMAVCLDKDLPIMVHTNEPVGHLYPGKTENTLSQIYRLLKRFPENKIVLAHWGGGIFFFNLLKREVKESFKNVYFDTAASPFLYDPSVYRVALQIIDPSRILFGSDYPLLEPIIYFKELEKTDLSQDEIEGICGRNAMRLLDL